MYKTASFPYAVANVAFSNVLTFILLKIKKMGFPGGSAGKESPCYVGNLGSIPGLGRSPGEGKGYPL